SSGTPTYFYQVVADSWEVGEVVSPEVGAATNNGVTLTWNAVPGAYAYKIYRYQAPPGVSGLLATVNALTLPDPTHPSYTDSNGTAPTTDPPLHAWLELHDTTSLDTITGPAAGVTISGGGLGQVFQIDASANASFSGLTITGGANITGISTGAGAVIIN